MSDILAFDYVGFDEQGRLQKGTLDAADRSTAAHRLRGMGITPSEITESKGSFLTRDLEFGALRKKIPLREIAMVSRELSTMLGAGLTLIRAVTVIEQQNPNPKLVEVFEEVHRDIEHGHSLSDSLERRGPVFPPLMVHLVRAGETGGFLSEALESAADAFDSELKLRDTVKAALTYPTIVLIVAILAVIAMLVFIVPVFEKMFHDLGGELPLPTQILVRLSNSMVWLGPLLLVLVLGAWMFWRRYGQQSGARRALDVVKQRMPVLGQLFRQVAVARFTRTLATTLSAGVPILQALSIVQRTAGSPLVEEAVERITEGVGRGRSISQLIALEDVFPPIVTNMVAVGEDTGQLDVMLRRVADFTDREVQQTTTRLTAIIEPVMIVIVGAIVGTMIISLYLPMFSIFDQISANA